MFFFVLRGEEKKWVQKKQTYIHIWHRDSKVMKQIENFMKLVIFLIPMKLENKFQQFVILFIRKKSGKNSKMNPEINPE